MQGKARKSPNITHTKPKDQNCNEWVAYATHSQQSWWAYCHWRYNV